MRKLISDNWTRLHHADLLAIGVTTRSFPHLRGVINEDAEEEPVAYASTRRK
jgi:hypothetical protein